MARVYSSREASARYRSISSSCRGDIVEAWQVIARYDVCAGTSLPDIQTRRGPQYTTRDWSLSMRVVKNGLLISTMRSIEHRGFDGHLINEYRGGDLEFFKLALDPDGETFWTGLGSQLSRFDLDTMQRIGTAETGQTEASPHLVHAMTVVDGWRAARTGSRRIPGKRLPEPRTVAIDD